MKTRPSQPRRQRGVVLLISLVVLVVMLAGALALTRDFTASLSVAGGLAFKRDLVNQSQRVLPRVLAELRAGGPLDTEAKRADHLAARNYSASILDSNAQGIPLALLDEAQFADVGAPANDIAVPEQAVTIRYLIDRLCSDTGPAQALGEAGCVTAPSEEAANWRSGSSSKRDILPPPPNVIYRVSVRVHGPRDTRAYFQTTLAAPSGS